MRNFSASSFRPMPAVRAKQKETEETEYIGKEEILKGIDAGLKEMVERKHSGNKAKTLEELINEL